MRPIAGDAFRCENFNMDMQTILDDWRANAERDSERNYRFLHSLKMKSEAAVDRVAHRLHEEAFAIIDCTKCANCCKTAATGFQRSDIERIAKHLGVEPDQFAAKYLEKDEFGDLLLKTVPCPFLGSDDRCTIYAVRPQDCRDYPHTHKEEFSSRTIGVSANTTTCPAVFYIVERMRAMKRK
jgi:uncharacterized protein